MVTGRATLRKQVLTGNQPTPPPQVIGLHGPMPPRRTGTASAPALPLRSGRPMPRPHPHTGLPTAVARSLPLLARSPGLAATVPAVTEAPVAGEAAMATVPSAASTATAQILAGVLGVKVVLGHPAPGPHGGEEATALTAHGLVGPLDLGAQTHPGLLGRAARLLLLLPLLSLPLSRVSPLLLSPMAFR